MWCTFERFRRHRRCEALSTASPRTILALTGRRAGELQRDCKGQAGLWAGCWGSAVWWRLYLLDWLGLMLVEGVV